VRRARYYYVYLAISLTYNRLPINWGVGTATPVNAPIGAQNSVDASHPHKTRGFLVDIAGEASGAPGVYPHAPDSEGPCATGSGFPNFAEVAHAPTVHIFQLVVSIRRAPDKSPETNFKFQLARDSGSGKSKAKLTPLLRFTNPGASKTRHVRIMRTQNPETTFCHCVRVRVDRKMSTTRIS